MYNDKLCLNHTTTITMALLMNWMPSTAGLRGKHPHPFLTQGQLQTPPLNWLPSFLTDRSHCVQLRDVTSGTKTTSTGAPQWWCILSLRLLLLLHKCLYIQGPRSQTLTRVFTPKMTQAVKSLKIINFYGQERLKWVKQWVTKLGWLN